MNAKEKLKKLVEEGTLTCEDLSELGIELDSEVEKSTEEPTGEQKVEEPEKIEEELTPTEASEEGKVPEPTSDENQLDTPTDPVPPAEEQNQEQDPQPTPTDNIENKTPEIPSYFNDFAEEIRKSIDGLSARLGAFEELLSKLSVPVSESNSDFGTTTNPSNTDDASSTDYMNNIIKRMGGFSR